MAKVGIVVFPGSNCDRDVSYVLNSVLGIEADLIWHTKERLQGYDAMIIPGGFAYGDRLRAGIIAAHSPIMNEVKRMAKDRTPILGICNGFQILVESDLLPGALLMNDSLRFVCRWTTVKVQNNKTPFTNQFHLEQKIRIPIAHGEGRYVADKQTVRNLWKEGRIVIQYSDYDPNGSVDFIAGISNKEGNVVGMMPHPERGSENILSPDNSNDPLLIFRSLASYLSESRPDYQRSIAEKNG